MFVFLTSIVDFLMDIFCILIFITIDIIIIKTYIENKLKKHITLYRIRTKNIFNILCLLGSLFLIFFYGIIIYKNIINNQKISEIINILESFTLVFLSLILFTCSLILLCLKSIIVNELIILSDGIFKIENVKNIERKNKSIKLYFKKHTVFAIFGYKNIYTDENTIDELYNYLNNKICQHST